MKVRLPQVNIRQWEKGDNQSALRYGLVTAL